MDDHRSRFEEPSLHLEFLNLNMISVDEAIELAKGFTIQQGEIGDGVFFIPSSPLELKDFYYFDFNLVDKDGNPPVTPMAGAPGFTISKVNGKAHIISWQEYHEIITLK